MLFTTRQTARDEARKKKMADALNQHEWFKAQSALAQQQRGEAKLHAHRKAQLHRTIRAFFQHMQRINEESICSVWFMLNARLALGGPCSPVAELVYTLHGEVSAIIYSIQAANGLIDYQKIKIIAMQEQQDEVKAELDENATVVAAAEHVLGVAILKVDEGIFAILKKRQELRLNLASQLQCVDIERSNKTALQSHNATAHKDGIERVQLLMSAAELATGDEAAANDRHDRSIVEVSQKVEEVRVAEEQAAQRHQELLGRVQVGEHAVSQAQTRLQAAEERNVRFAKAVTEYSLAMGRREPHTNAGKQQSHKLCLSVSL